MTDLPKNQISF